MLSEKPIAFILPLPDNGDEIVLTFCLGCEQEERNPIIAAVDVIHNPIGARAAQSIALDHMTHYGADHELIFVAVGLYSQAREVSPPLINGRVVTWLSPHEPKVESNERPYWFVSPDSSRFFH